MVFRKETWVPILFPNLIIVALASVVRRKPNSGGLSQSHMRQFGAAVSPSNSSLPGRKNCSMDARRSCFPTCWTRPQPFSLPMALLVSQRPAHSLLSSVEDRSEPCINQCVSSCLGRRRGRSEASHLQSSKIHICRPSPSLFHVSSTSLPLIHMTYAVAQA